VRLRNDCIGHVTWRGWNDRISYGIHFVDHGCGGFAALVWSWRMLTCFQKKKWSVFRCEIEDCIFNGRGEGSEYSSPDGKLCQFSMITSTSQSPAIMKRNHPIWKSTFDHTHWSFVRAASVTCPKHAITRHHETQPSRLKIDSRTSVHWLFVGAASVTCPNWGD
jgi:hypothetical protein